jgi:hypothetical protein
VIVVEFVDDFEEAFEGFGVGNFAHEDVAGGVDAALGVGVEHSDSGKEIKGGGAIGKE